MGFKLKGSTLYGGPMKQKNQEINPIIGDKTKAQQRKEFDAETARINKRDNVKPVSIEKTDLKSGSTRKKGDYATYGSQAYDKKGNKTNFEDFENTSTVSIDKKGRPSVKNSKGETVYLSSANEKGQPMSRKEDR